MIDVLLYFAIETAKRRGTTGILVTPSWLLGSDECLKPVKLRLRSESGVSIDLRAGSVPEYRTLQMQLSPLPAESIPSFVRRTIQVESEVFSQII
ncbi:hypothetical protein Moror_5021 [Moniliophthora roreri MCA 2997]|uniref:Uncharacterized protein n=1 Tax=Moniliophthora roreri (strain MCA 2997) TaxID=1381753 RepID=V2Y3Z3_MONRO|nr:hypothetical protein Moror_5021 [Moniliophthora roreri MCA 2997]